MTYDPVAVIEAAYRTGVEDRDWLKTVVRETALLFEPGQPLVAILLDRTRGPAPLAETGVNRCPASEVAGAIFREASLADSNVRRRLSFGPLTSLRRTAAGLEVEDRLAAVGLVDSLFLLAGDPDNAMCIVAIPRFSKAGLPRQKRYALVHLAAHIASGARLRSHAAKGGSPEEAILTPAGKVEHAEQAAQMDGGLGLLRAAALCAERARGGLRRSAPEEAIAIWMAMVDGRWSLVDRFDQDGRRFLVARRNEPRAGAFHTLSHREMYIASQVARGHGNKLIAYELGLSEATIATHVSRVKAKLGVRTRVELATLLLAVPAPGH